MASNDDSVILVDLVDEGSSTSSSSEEKNDSSSSNANTNDNLEASVEEIDIVESEQTTSQDESLKDSLEDDNKQQPLFKVMFRDDSISR